MQEFYPDYNKIIKNEIDKDNFNYYLENKINDDELIKNVFNQLFI